METVQIIINGKVQGVWYRKSTLEKATELGIKGTVENLSTGQVKVVAQGKQKSLEDFIEWTKKGPKFAKVQSIEINPVDEPLQYGTFKIIR